MRLFYIRHGAPCYNPNCLTKRGHYEAEEVSKFLATKNIKKIISSDSNRAIQTAEHLASKIGLKIEQHKFLNEDNSWAYFSIEISDGGRDWFFYIDDFIIKSKDIYMKKQYWKYEPFSNYDFHKKHRLIGKQLDKLLLSLNIKHDRKNNTYEAIGDVPENVAIFAHGGMGYAVISSLINESLATFTRNYVGLEPAGIVEIEIDLENRHTARIINYNAIHYDMDVANSIPNEI